MRHEAVLTLYAGMLCFLRIPALTLGCFSKISFPSCASKDAYMSSQESLLYKVEESDASDVHQWIEAVLGKFIPRLPILEKSADLGTTQCSFGSGLSAISPGGPQYVKCCILSLHSPDPTHKVISRAFTEKSAFAKGRSLRCCRLPESSF